MNQDETPLDDAAAAGKDPDKDAVSPARSALYALAYVIGIAVMLLIPRLLNNMIMVIDCHAADDLRRAQLAQEASPMSWAAHDFEPYAIQAPRQACDDAAAVHRVAGTEPDDEVVRVRRHSLDSYGLSHRQFSS